MSEETKTVEKVETQSTSMSDALKTSQTEQLVAPSVPSETVPEPKVETPEVKPVVETDKEKAQPETDKAVSGVLKGMQAERKRRQALEEEVRQLRSQLNAPQDIYTPAVEEVPQSNQIPPDYENKVLTISETQARAAHPDFQEKFDLFMEATASNPTLAQMVMNSDHPGEAAYQAGKTLMIQKKYGTSLDEQIENIRKETREELKKQLRAEVEAELSGKVATKLNQPTNILSARSASGGDGKSSFQPSSFRDLLGKKSR